MEFGIVSFSSGLIQKQAVNEVIQCNDFTKRFGLLLTLEQAAELVDTRYNALSQNGRIEFGGGVIDKIIKEFCDSPYIAMHNYVNVINELIEIFYYYKTQMMDLISDDELIQYMKKAFDGNCQGSLELLSGKALDQLDRNLRCGYNREDSGEELSEEDEDA